MSTHVRSSINYIHEEIEEESLAPVAMVNPYLYVSIETVLENTIKIVKKRVGSGRMSFLAPS